MLCTRHLQFNRRNTGEFIKGQQQTPFVVNIVWAMQRMTSTGQQVKVELTAACIGGMPRRNYQHT